MSPWRPPGDRPTRDIAPVNENWNLGGDGCEEWGVMGCKEKCVSWGPMAQEPLRRSILDIGYKKSLWKWFSTLETNWNRQLGHQQNSGPNTDSWSPNTEPKFRYYLHPPNSWWNDDHDILVSDGAVDDDGHGCYPLDGSAGTGVPALVNQITLSGSQSIYINMNLVFTVRYQGPGVTNSQMIVNVVMRTSYVWLG